MATAAPKRGPFSKPSWASRSTNSTNAGSDRIFGNRVYEGILEAEKRHKEAEAAALKARRETPKEQESEPSSKRRRISHDSGQDADATTLTNGDESGNQDSSKIVNMKPRSTSKKNMHAVRVNGPHSATIPSPAKATSPGVSVIEIADNRQDNKRLSVTTATKAVPKSSPNKLKPLGKPQDAEFGSEDEDEDDEYMQELKRKARERAQLRNSGSQADQPLSGVASELGVRSPSHEHLASASPLDISGESQAKLQKLAPVDDPTLRLLVTTKIPGGKPLIVTRRASQTMKQVKEYWCQRQGFNATMTAKIFLTWRGTKLWNSSTMQGPLKKLRQERPLENFDIKDQDHEAGAELKGGRIEIVAMTEELLQEYLRYKERQENGPAGSDSAAEDDDHDDHDHDHNTPRAVRGLPSRPTEVSQPTVKDDNSIVLRLSSQGLEPMLLRVRPSTEIHRIMAGFKKTRNLDTAKTAWLVFDGRRLDPQETVADVELEHEDAIEVHVK